MAQMIVTLMITHAFYAAAPPICKAPEGGWGYACG